jgi:hypothetical protein
MLLGWHYKSYRMMEQLYTTLTAATHKYWTPENWQYRGNETILQ